MGKVDENKHQKMDALFQSAYDLFLNQGIEKTSISDIAKKAGVANGNLLFIFCRQIRDTRPADCTDSQPAFPESA